jgi:hypothetical protein
MSAAPLQLATDEPVMAIGGFTGTDPAPTLGAFQRYVAHHKIHYFVSGAGIGFPRGSGDASQISSWVETHFTKTTVGGETVYNLTIPAAAGQLGPPPTRRDSRNATDGRALKAATSRSRLRLQAETGQTLQRPLGLPAGQHMTIASSAYA